MAWAFEDLDPWVPRVLQFGYQIPFVCRPPLTTTPVAFPTYRQDSPRHQALQAAVEAMVAKAAIEPVNPQSPGFYSRLFVVPKATGGWRPVIDLSPLNKSVSQTKFRMETPRQVLASIHLGDWMVSLDRKDAYFPVPIHKKSRPFLRFLWGPVVFQFRALCFGLSTAPQVFTRVMGVVAALCHRQGIRLHRYLDDWLILASSEPDLSRDRDWVLQLARDLGLLVNMEKSELVPCTRLCYLGMDIDTTLGLAFPTPGRVEKLLQLIQQFRDLEAPPALEWLRLLGHLVSLEKLVPWGRLHLRSLQFQLRSHWSQATDSKWAPVPHSADVLLDLIWWVDPRHLLAGVPFQQPLADVQLFTDASTQGWGAHLLDLQASGLWSPQEARLHINILELKAVRLGLESFLEFCRDQTVLVMSDNSTVVSHIRHQGGTRSWQLCARTLGLLRWCQEQNVQLQSRFIPGRRNVLADQLSRRAQVLPAEWSLHPDVCHHLWKVWGAPHIDLFATRLNHRLPVYCSPLPDPQAWATDALVTPWDHLWTYAYPPPALLGAVIHKFGQTQNSRMLLVAPLWPQQPWFAELLHLLVDHPRELPLWRSLLKQPHLDRFHPTPEVFRLHAWLLSSSLSEQRAFRSSLPPGSPELPGNQPLTCTRPNGPSSVVGAVLGRQILSSPLFPS